MGYNHRAKGGSAVARQLSNAERFVERYKKLEKAVRAAYGLKDSDSISYYLTKQEKFKKYKAEIKLCQNVRNVLQHEQRFGEAYPVEPSEDMLELIDELINALGRHPYCIDIAIRRVYSQPPDGPVRQTIALMRQKGFTHVPILEAGVAVGVFDENAAFNYMADHGSAIGEDLRFSDMREYTSLTGRDSEDFLFVDPKLLAEELEDRFEAASRRARRIGLTFVTDGGDPAKPIQGIITPWDIFKV